MKKTKKRSVAAKILISCLIVALVIGLSYLAYYLINYTFYDDYKDDFLPITYAEGSEFKALSDSSRPEELSEGYVLAAESKALKLYYNETTTEVAVYDITKDKITYSNPQNIDESDYDNALYLNKMNSQLVVYYYPTDSANAIAEMNSYEYCVNMKPKEGQETVEKQFKVEAIPNGIRIIYTIGDLSSETGTIATYISKDTFDDIIKKLEDYDKENGTKYRSDIFYVYSESKDVKGFMQLNEGVKKRQMQKMQECLELIGWTEEDFEREMEASGVEFEMPTSFTVPLEYTLNNDKLSVNVCTDHIVETGSGSLIYMDVLPYFGATYYSYETDNYVGYIYTIDETATNAVAVREQSEFLTVNSDGTNASVSVDSAIAGEFTSATFTVYALEMDEYGHQIEGSIVSSWNSNPNSGASPVLNLESGKEYILKVTGNNMGEEFEQEIKFVADKEKLASEGYFLVPNGSGSLIYMNSTECDGIADYTEKIYGTDDVMFDTDMRIQETVGSKLPVYGWYDNNDSIFVILTRGESLAELRVQTANDVTCKASTSLANYNNAYCRYYLRGENKVEMSSTDSFNVWTEEIFKTQITQQYCFLSDDFNGYSGMANYYRDYLVAEGQLVNSEEDSSEDIEMYIDILGAIKGDASFLGFAYQSVIPLTTFDEAQEILNKFYENDINNIVVNYQGWMNDGYYHNSVDDIKVIRKLGGKSGLSDLTELVEGKGGKLYGDMAISTVTFAAEDFPYTLESSRLFGTGYVAGFGKTSPTTYSNSASLGYIANLYDILSPKFLSRYVDSALKDTENINISGISYRDIANQLYSDLKKTNIIHREQSKEILVAQLAKIAEGSKDVMFNAPYSFGFKYCDDIINAPIGDNNYIYVDRDVPFYEMVIHGYIDYSVSPINLSADSTVDGNVLQCIEYGAYPHFTFTYVPSTEMKYTALNNMYATYYVNWIEDATAVYNEVNSVLSKVADAQLVDHEMLDNNNMVKKLTYSNNVVIYVNYLDETFNADGVSIPANDYVVEVAK